MGRPDHVRADRLRTVRGARRQVICARAQALGGVPMPSTRPTTASLTAEVDRANARSAASTAERDEARGRWASAAEEARAYRQQRDDVVDALAGLLRILDGDLITYDLSRARDLVLRYRRSKR